MLITVDFEIVSIEIVTAIIRQIPLYKAKFVFERCFD